MNKTCRNDKRCVIFYGVICREYKENGKQKSNYEIINELDIEEMTRFIKKITDCLYCPAKKYGCSVDCKKAVKEWLESEEE